jgi:PsbP
LVIVVVAILFLSGGFVLIKDKLFSGSSLKSSDLISESKDGIEVKHPKQWAKTEEPETILAYADNGKVDDSDHGLVVMSQTLPVDFDTLPKDQADAALNDIKDSIDDPEQYEDDSCKEVSSATAEVKSHDNYKNAVYIEVKCNKIQGRALKGTLKGVALIDGTKFYGVFIVAPDQTWDKSASVLQEIIDSVKPAN